MLGASYRHSRLLRARQKVLRRSAWVVLLPEAVQFQLTYLTMLPIRDFSDLLRSQRPRSSTVWLCKQSIEDFNFRRLAKRRWSQFCLTSSLPSFATFVYTCRGLSCSDSFLYPVRGSQANRIPPPSVPDIVKTRKKKGE